MEKKPELKLFQNDDFGTIRTVILDGEPWFVAADVCKILEHSNPTIAMNGLEDFEKTKLNLGLQGVILISSAKVDFILWYYAVENLLQSHLEFG